MEARQRRSSRAQSRSPQSPLRRSSAPAYVPEPSRPPGEGSPSDADPGPQNASDTSRSALAPVPGATPVPDELVQRISIQNLDQLSLLGQNDATLRALEQQVPVAIIVRTTCSRCAGRTATCAARRACCTN